MPQPIESHSEQKMYKRLTHLLTTRPMTDMLALSIWAVLLATAPGCGSGSGTSLPEPEVVSTLPADGAMGVPPGVVVSAEFNQQMNLSTVNDATFVLGDSSGTLVPGRVAYDSATFTATFTPDLPLAPNATYTAGISSGVANVADTPLANDVSWTFTTGTSS